MADETLGTLRGRIVLEVNDAINAYTDVRKEHLSTISALGQGADALNQVGRGLLGAGVAIGAGLAISIGAAAEFEKRLDYFGAVSGSTAKQMELVSEKALQLGEDTIYSANQVADAFVELGKAGVGAEDLVNGVGDAVVNLGAAADIDLTKAAESITLVTSTWGMLAEDAPKIADVIAGAANSSIIGVEDMQLSLKYAGGVAAAAGVSFEDTATAIALLGNYGIKGSTAGTSLRQSFFRMTPATEKATTALKDLGIITDDGANKFYDAEGKMKPLGEVFEELKVATDGLSDAQKLAAIRDIFGIIPSPAMLNLLSEGAAGFDEMAASIDKVSAEDVASGRLDNLMGDIELLKGSLETLMIDSGSGFQQWARGFIQGIDGMVNAFSNLDPGMQQMILNVAAITAVVLTVLGGLAMFAGWILQMIALYKTLVPLLKIIATFLKLQALWAILSKGVMAAAGAFKALTLAMLTNPIVLLVVAIVALVAALVWFFTSTDLGREIWGGFVNWLKSLVDGFVSWWLTIWPPIAQFFIDVWNNIVNVVMTIWNTYWAFVVAFWTPIIGFFVNVWNAVVTAWNAIWNVIITVVTTIFTVVYNIVKFYIEASINIILIIAAVMVTIWNAIVALVVFVWTTIVNFLTPIITTLVNFFVAQFNILRDFWEGVWFAVSSFFINMWNQLIAFLTPIVMWLIDAITVAVTTVSVTWQQTWDAISKFFMDIWNGIMAFLAPIIAGIQNAITTAVNFISSTWRRTWDTVFNFFRDIWNNVTTTFNRGVEMIKTLANQIFENVVGPVRGAGSWLVSAGRDVLIGFWNGFQSWVSTLWDKVSGVFNGVVDWAKKTLGIASPSRVFRYEVGQQVGAGAILGIDDMAADVYSAMENMLTVPVAPSIDMVGSLAGLADLYDTVGATMDFDAQVGSSTYITDGREDELAAIRALLQELKDEPRTKVDINSVTNNPVAKTTGEALVADLDTVSTMTEIGMVD